MNLKDYTQEEIHSMSYDDVAYMILKEANTKMKINDLFRQVADMFNLSDDAYISQIGDFFELLSTDQRFIMVDKGFWDLKSKYSAKVIIDEDEEEEIIPETNEEDEEKEEDEDLFFDNDEPDDNDDDLQDLVVVDEDEDEANNM